MNNKKKFQLPIFLLALLMLLPSALTGCGAIGSGNKDDDIYKDAEVVKVADCGAVGDGKTDDAAAIDAALDMVKVKGKDGKHVVLEFEKDKSYYIKDMYGETVVFRLENYKNLTIKGDNTTLIMDRTKNLCTWFYVLNSENITIQGLNVKMSNPMYTFSKVDAIHPEGDNPYIDITTEISLGITEKYTAGYYISHNGNSVAFGVPYTGDVNRMHIYINAIEPLDANANKYRVWCRNYDSHEMKMKYMKENDLPFMIGIPGWARYGKEDGDGAFISISSTDITVKDFNVWMSSTCTFHMRNNYGTFNFKNVNVTNEPGTDDVLASWTDIFHLKENRCKFIMEDCLFEKSQDDVFNFSTTNLLVDKVISETEFVLICKQLGGYWMPLQEGDVITLFHERTGMFVGRTTIKEIVEQGVNTHIVVNDALPMIGVGVAAYVDSLGQPGSVIKNCTINGTWRLRTEMTVENCTFGCLYGWIDIYPTNEGPIPRNIKFKNCVFKPLKAEDPEACYISSEYMMQIGTQTIPTSGIPAHYYAENIVFEDCDIDINKISFMEDTADVTFIKDGEVYHTAEPKKD